LIDAVQGTFDDLAALGDGTGGVQNILGAIQKAGTTYNTFKGKNIASIVNQEALQAAKDIARQSLPGAVRLAVGSANGMLFPKPPVTPTSTSTTTPDNQFNQGGY
jgi:hypothetical protein